jgi:prophage regulatory protein
MNTETTTLLLTADEVATMLNVSERTLWRLLSAGKVPKPVRFGRSTRWRDTEVKEWVERGCPGGKS